MERPNPGPEYLLFRGQPTRRAKRSKKYSLLQPRVGKTSPNSTEIGLRCMLGTFQSPVTGLGPTPCRTESLLERILSPNDHCKPPKAWKKSVGHVFTTRSCRPRRSSRSSIHNKWRRPLLTKLSSDMFRCVPATAALMLGTTIIFSGTEKLDPSP